MVPYNQRQKQNIRQKNDIRPPNVRRNMRTKRKMAEADIQPSAASKTRLNDAENAAEPRNATSAPQRTPEHEDETENGGGGHSVERRIKTTAQRCRKRGGTAQRDIRVPPPTPPFPTPQSAPAGRISRRTEHLLRLFYQPFRSI